MNVNNYAMQTISNIRLDKINFKIRYYSNKMGHFVIIKE